MTNKYCNILDMKTIDQKIDEAMIRAKETGKEFGFNFCSIGGKVTATSVEEGERNSLDIENKCPAGSIVGAFHVHTKVGKILDVIPSPSDITKGITDQDITFFCIGASVNNQNIIRCFTKEDLEKEMNAILKTTLEIPIKDITKSSRIISSKMMIKKKYLDRLSCSKIKV